MLKNTKIMVKKDFLINSYYAIKRSHPISSTRQGIQNLIKWFRVIWSDRDWDDYFIYEILKKKLENMEKCFRKHGYSVCSKDRADQMRRCIILLDRIMKDEYDSQEDKKHEKKWGELKISYESVDDVWSKMIGDREKVVTEKDKEQERKDFMRSYKKAAHRKQYDIDYLFNYMSKHVQGWWD